MSAPRERPFLGYDGESIGKRYVLLANAEHYLYNRRGLSSAECLAFLLEPMPRNPIRVFYGMSFDIAHILSDLPDNLLLLLYRAEPVDWNVFHLSYLPGKRFTVRMGKKARTYYDTFGWFASSFLTACRDWGVTTPKIIGQGKRARGQFAKWGKARLVDYNRAECIALGELMRQVRIRLNIRLRSGPELMPRAWHGVGASASKVLRASRAGRSVWPEHTYIPGYQQILASAYFGGRIENTVAGTIAGPIYRYDLHAAYSWALCQLPPLSFRWEHTRDILAEHPFAIYRLRWDMRPYLAYHAYPGPLPWRDKEGYIIFRGEGEGWYWAPEAERAIAAYPGIEVLDGFVLPDSGERPLATIVHELFQVRNDEEAYHSPMAGLLKRVSNALYGKFIQATKVNRYYSLTWAGFTTALIRGRMLEAIITNPSAILASLTDGIISSERLPLTLGSGMGQWTEDIYTKALILAPGVYRLGDAGAKGTLSKWRGFTVPDFPFGRVLREVYQTGESAVPMPLFVSPIMGILAPAAYGRHRLQFITEPRTIHPLRSHKRYFYHSLASQQSERIDLSHKAVTSRLVMAPPGDRAIRSWPYMGGMVDELAKEERASLELTSGIWGL